MSLQARLRALREAREAQPPQPKAEPAPKPPKPPKKEKLPLYVEPDRRWKKLSEEEAAMLDDQADAILERAAKSPFTLSKALANYPQPVLRHLCIRETVPVPHATTRGQRPRAVFVEALSEWFQQRAMTAEAQDMPVHQKPKRSQPKPEPAPEPEPQLTPEELASRQLQDYERDCGEIRSGNDSIVLFRRVQATLRLLVSEGTLTQADADSEMEELKAARA